MLNLACYYTRGADDAEPPVPAARLRGQLPGAGLPRGHRTQGRTDKLLQHYPALCYLQDINHICYCCASGARSIWQSHDWRGLRRLHCDPGAAPRCGYTQNHSDTGLQGEAQDVM